MGNQQVDIVHLTFKPPFATGSYNRLVGVQLERLTEFRQVAISYWDKPFPEKEVKFTEDNKLILVDGRGLSLWKKVYLRLPECIRGYWFNGISGQEHLIYTWKLLEIIPQLRPKVIVCYDSYKLGRLLKQVINWPCRIILAQRGFSYYFTRSQMIKVYSLEAFDVVWLQTYGAYRFDRQRTDYYEPSVVVIPNGVDVNQYRPVTFEEKRKIRSQWGLPSDRLIVLLLSRLVPKKGIHLVVQSWPAILDQVPNAFLWVVGGGEEKYRRYIEAMIRTLSVEDTVRLEGPVSPEDTTSCYQASDLYVFPTLFCEGMANTLLEAMACGLPCIVSDHPPGREICSDQVVLFVNDPNIEDAFLEPIVRLLRDDTLRARLGQAARQWVEQYYSLEQMLDHLRKFYFHQLCLVGEKR